MKIKKPLNPRSEKSSNSPETLLLQQSSLKKLSMMMAILCAVIGFFLYANTLGHSYTVDDDTVMMKNKIVTKGITAIPEILTTPYRKGFWDRQEAMYRPLSLVMFAVEWQLSPEKPFLGHLVNVLLYALTGFVLFGMLRKILISFNILIPFFATLLFMVHPLHTEVVANIKSRDEILSLLFLILSLNFLFGYYKDQRQKILKMILSLCCFLLALLSKESAVTFILLFPLALFFFTELPVKKVLLYSSLFVIPLALYFGMRFHALQGINTHTDILPINNSLVKAENEISRIATAISIMGKYLGLLILPLSLSFDYSYNQIPNVTFVDAVALISLFIYAALVFIAIRTFRKKNIFAFCILYFFITVSLVSNLVIMIESTMAERFLYTASLGFCIALPALIAKLFKIDLKKLNVYNWKTLFSVSKPLTTILFLSLILYSGKTISRNADWKTNYTLLKKDVKTCPNSARIRYALGSEIYFKISKAETDPVRKQALIDEAIAQLERGTSILPAYGEAFYGLGLAYTDKSDGANAVRCFEAAKTNKTWDEAPFFVSSGLAYGLLKQYDNAFVDFKKALGMDSTLKEAYNNWGLYLLETGNVTEAIEKLDKAIALDSSYVSALYNRGNACAQSQEYREAIAWYERVLVLDPKYTNALTNIGNCYAAMEEIPLAIQSFEKVIAIDPNNVNANTNLSVAYHQIGNEEKSKEYAAKIPGRK